VELSEVRASELSEAGLIAKEWIICNQLARRNLSLFQRARLVLTREEIIKLRSKLRQGERRDLTSSNELEEVAGGTDRKLAKMSGVSHETIHRVRTIEREATPEAKEELAQGKTTISKEYRKLRPKNKAPSIPKPFFAPENMHGILFFEGK